MRPEDDGKDSKGRGEGNSEEKKRRGSRKIELQSACNIYFLTSHNTQQFITPKSLRNLGTFDVAIVRKVDESKLIVLGIDGHSHLGLFDI